MITKLAALLALPALVLAACGGDDVNLGDGADTPVDTVTDAPGPDEPVTGAPGDPGQEPAAGDGAQVVTDANGMDAKLVTPAGDTQNPQPSAYDHVEVDGTTATVFFYTGVEPCSVVDRVEVDESGEDVVITVFVGSQADAATSCIALAEYKAAQVTLTSELGDRQVVDGAA